MKRVLGILCIVAQVAMLNGAAHGEEVSRRQSGGVAAAATSPHDVRSFGAKGDGVTKDTAAVNRGIEACAKSGGGTLCFAAGTYLCGSLHLRSGVTLRLEAGATIKGSPDNADYDAYEKLEFKNAADAETSFFHRALIWGENVERVGIVGEGTIDGNRSRRRGPKIIALKRCKFVNIQGVRLLNAPNYNISMLGTDFVNIEGVTILNGYADGIDPDACRNVRIANCHVESVDDAIVPKTSFSLGERRGCENILVTNCFLATHCYCFKLGTESGGDFKRIAVSNCVMAGLAERSPAAGGIALESVDGANIDGVVVSNVSMHNVLAPIFLRLGNRGRDMTPPMPGSLKNVSISNVVATDAGWTCPIAGIPGHDVEGVTLSDIRMAYCGGGLLRPISEPVPEQVAKYPNADMFGALPAYGLYCRHVAGLTLHNVQLLADEHFRRSADRWRPRQDTDPPTPSQPVQLGPALVCDDVRTLRIDGLDAHAAPDGAPLIVFSGVRDALIRGCMAPRGTNAFLELAGTLCEGISIISNDLSQAQKVVDGPAAAASVHLTANRTQ